MIQSLLGKQLTSWKFLSYKSLVVTVKFEDCLGPIKFGKHLVKHDLKTSWKFNKWKPSWTCIKDLQIFERPIVIMCELTDFKKLEYGK